MGRLRGNTIQLHIDDTYNSRVWNGCRRYNGARTTQINRGYGILVESSKLGNSRKYKFTNITVMNTLLRQYLRLHSKVK